MAWLPVAAIAIYLLLLLPLALGQRRLLYVPRRLEAPPSAFGLPDAETLKIETAGGAPVSAWYQAAIAGAPLVLFFHGNGGNLSHRADLFRRFIGQGWGFLAIDYPGYGASSGKPTEVALMRAGEAAYAKALAIGYPGTQIVAFGESLGSGIAVPLAAAHPVRALILDSAFTATVDIAAARYWMVPVRLLMLDQYRSRDTIAAVKGPKLFLHATKDPIVPIASDRALFALAQEPKTFLEIAGRHHIVAERAFEAIADWLAALPAP